MSTSKIRLTCIRLGTFRPACSYKIVVLTSRPIFLYDSNYRIRVSKLSGEVFSRGIDSDVVCENSVVNGGGGGVVNEIVA